MLICNVCSQDVFYYSTIKLTTRHGKFSITVTSELSLPGWRCVGYVIPRKLNLETECLCSITKLFSLLFCAVFVFLLSTGGFPINKVTPEGLIFVSQWVLVALIGYWLLSLALRLVASTLRQFLWLLKLSVALVCFGLILSDHSVKTETIAIRLAVLVSVCILLGVGRGSNAADKTAYLEEQVKILERRLKEMESWRKTEEWRDWEKSNVGLLSSVSPTWFNMYRWWCTAVPFGLGTSMEKHFYTWCFL